MNPLLEIQFRFPFDKVTPADIEPAIDELLAEATRALEQAVQSPDPLSALDVMTEKLDFAMSVVRHLESVATTPEWRVAHNAVQPKASAFYSAIPLHEGLWKALKRYAETPAAKALDATRRRFLTKTMDSFKRHGADLDAAGKERLKQIDVALTERTTKFSENVLDATNAWELILTDEKQLAGLPPAAIAAARASFESKNKTAASKEKSADAKSADENNTSGKGEGGEAAPTGGWRFTLQGPSYIAVMTYLDDPAIRERMWRAYAVRAAAAPYDNAPLIVKILELRREKARLLGFRDFADLVLEDRMAHTGAAAQAFLDALRTKTEPRFREENAELEAFARSVTGAPRLELAPWDVAYWAEKQRAALYDFDEEALRPYLSLERVTSGMFDIFGRLFGIRVEEEKNVPAWDPAVRSYGVYDANSNQHLGSFYTDWYPRENKRGGAWMDALITGDPARKKPHLGFICGNLTPPVDGKPALLTHREAETIFHEFGHLLHHLLSRVEVRSLAGTSVAWDFVELPSQIMENWCWERPSLDLLARHWETGEPIPEDLFQKMKRAKTFRAANTQMRQLGFGSVDLGLHRLWDPSENVLQYARETLAPFTATPLPPDYAMIAGFTHLFSSPVGYGAGYYSYKWAEVLDADAFTRFRKEGVFNADTGRDYREKILARGDSEDPAVLYRSFMGRDPDPSALLVRAGLL